MQSCWAVIPRATFRLGLIAVLLLAAAATTANGADANYLQLAQRGAAQAQRTWRDHRDKRRHGDRRWYDERLHDHDTYPLATIWGAVPLFETLDLIELAHPSRKNRRAVDAFAHGAERYWDRRLTPGGGYAPYPGDRAPDVQTWMDDNGWWGLGFLDAWRATHESRYLADAERGFNYAYAAGWDPAAGGLWWNTHHPYKSGVAMGANALLSSLLYTATHDPSYLSTAEQLIGWATQNLWNAHDQLYAKDSFDQTSQPYVEGGFAEAHEVICQATGDSFYCNQARTLADRSYARFFNRYSELNQGPQYDVIYLRVMLEYGKATGETRWRALASHEAERALVNARTGNNVYLRAWDGSDMSRHQAAPGMLRTDAATVELFAALAGA